MTRDDYIRQVEAVLDAHAEDAAARLRAALRQVPSTAGAITIGIFVDQGGEGLLDVVVGLDGPDLHVLQRAIVAHATLFDTRLTAAGLAPPLPLMDPADAGFEVADALTDCATRWIATLWARVRPHGCALPVSVVSHDGHGRIPPLRLQ